MTFAIKGGEGRECHQDSSFSFFRVIPECQNVFCTQFEFLKYSIFHYLPYDFANIFEYPYIYLQVPNISPGEDKSSGQAPYDCTTQRRSSLSPQLDKVAFFLLSEPVFFLPFFVYWGQLECLVINIILCLPHNCNYRKVEELLQRMETLKGKQTSLPPKEELTVRQSLKYLDKSI